MQKRVPDLQYALREGRTEEVRHGYSYYAAASLRWFFRTDEKRPEEFVTGVAEENWNACERTMAAQTEERIAVLREVYCSRDGMSAKA